MLEALAAPPPKPAAPTAPASSARGQDRNEAGFQGMLREALDLPAEGDRAPGMQATPKPAETTAESTPEAKITKVPENLAEKPAAAFSLSGEVPQTAEPADAASAAIALPELPVIHDTAMLVQAGQDLLHMVAAEDNKVTTLGVLPSAAGIVAMQPLANTIQPSQPPQDTAQGEAASLAAANPPMAGAVVAAPPPSDKAADMGEVARLPSVTPPMAGAVVAAPPPSDKATDMGEVARLPTVTPPMAGAVVAAPPPSDKVSNDGKAPLLEGQLADAGAAATLGAAQKLESIPAAGAAALAPSTQALATQDTATRNQVQPAPAAEEALAQALAAAPAQAAASASSPKPQAAGNTAKPGPIAPSPITPAEAALAATRPAEAASRLAQAFNATEAAADMKLVMAAETAEASLRLTSLEAPKNIGAKPSGEARAEAVPMAAFGLAPTDGMAPRAEAASPSTNLREAPAPAPARQLAPVVVSLALGRGDEALTIALDPVELGRVEVSIGQGKEAGQVRIVAERPETLALLQRDQRELDRALNQSGLGDMARSLSFSLASDQGRHQHQGSAHGRGQRASMTISGIEADRAMSALPALHRNPNALIDIAV